MWKLLRIDDSVWVLPSFALPQVLLVSGPVDCRGTEVEGSFQFSDKDSLGGWGRFEKLVKPVLVLSILYRKFSFIFLMTGARWWEGTSHSRISIRDLWEWPLGSHRPRFCPACPGPPGTRGLGAGHGAGALGPWCGRVCSLPFVRARLACRVPSVLA